MYKRISLACYLVLSSVFSVKAQEEKLIWIYVTDSRGAPIPNVSVTAAEWGKPVTTTSSGKAAVPVSNDAKAGAWIHLVIVSRYYATASGGSFGLRIRGFNKPSDPIAITLVRKPITSYSQARTRSTGPRANELDPFQRGERAFAAQRFQEAFEYFSKAYEIRKDAHRKTPNRSSGARYAEVSRSLGQILIALNRWHEAQDKFQEALRVNPKDDESQFLLGLCATMLGDVHQIEKAFRELMTSGKPTTKAIGALMTSGLYRDFGKLDESTRLEQEFFQQMAREDTSDVPEVSNLLKLISEVILDSLRGDKYVSHISSVLQLAATVEYKARLALAEKKSGTYGLAVVRPLNDLASFLQGREQYADAEALRVRSLSIEKRVLGHDHLSIGLALLKLADLETKEEKYSDAEGHYSEAGEILEKSLGRNHFWLDSIHSGLATLYGKQNRYIEAELHWTAIKEMYCKPDGSTKALCLAALGQLSDFYSEQDKYAEAIPPLRHALEIAEQMWAGKDSVGTAVILEIIDDLEDLYRRTKADRELESLENERKRIAAFGIAPKKEDVEVWSSREAETAIGLNGNRCGFIPHAEFTKYPKAKALLETTEKAGKYLDPRDSDLIEAIHALAFIYNSENRLDEAESLVKRALKSNEDSLQPDRHTTASLVALRGAISLKRGNYAAAEKDYEDSVQILDIIGGQDREGIIGVLFSLGQIQRERHNYAEAETSFKRALKMTEDAKEEPVCFDPDSVSIVTELAILYVRMEKFADADKSFRQALLAIGDCCLGSYSYSVYILENYAQCLRRMGRVDDAKNMELRARDIESRKHAH